MRRIVSLIDLIGDRAQLAQGNSEVIDGAGAANRSVNIAVSLSESSISLHPVVVLSSTNHTLPEELRHVDLIKKNGKQGKRLGSRPRTPHTSAGSKGRDIESGRRPKAMWTALTSAGILVRGRGADATTDLVRTSPPNPRVHLGQGDEAAEIENQTLLGCCPLNILS
ncbi:hypothetical protein [Flaviflexus equikiangi]|uniref:hypothetical protein n=1 Tax=Flaviflexus equikiangi TaxID=2758573 RepID=UPI0015F3F48A|nr:hypothetical protein [Flaviflexus equikiangi]